MLISESKKLLFIHNQRTGGASVSTFLFERVSDMQHLLPNHAYASDGEALLGAETWNEYYSFGFVRNPWSRLVSWYKKIMSEPDAFAPPDGHVHKWTPNNELRRYAKEHSSNFKEFILNCTETITENRDGFLYKKSFATDQLDYFTDANGKIIVSFIGKFENLQDDFSRVAERLKISGHGLPKINSTKTVDYRTYYDEETRQIVAERFKKDIEMFGYEF